MMVVMIIMTKFGADDDDNDDDVVVVVVFVVDDADDCGIVDVDDDGNYDGDFSSHRSVTEQRGALPTSDTKWRHSVSQTFHLLW